MRCPRSPGEKESVAAPSPQCGEEPDVGDGDVLRLVHDREIEHGFLALRERGRERREQLRLGDHLARFQAVTDPGEDRPQDLPLRLGNARLPPQARHVAIGVPIRQLPRVHDLRPFGHQKVQAEFVAANVGGGLLHQIANHVAFGDGRRTDVGLVEALPNGVERMHVDTLGQTRFARQQPPELRLEGIGERIGEGRQQNAGVGVGPGEKRRAMQGDDGLPRARRSGHPHWPGVVPFDQLALVGMEKDRPLLPREVQSALELLHIRHQTEPALCVRVLERIYRSWGGRWRARLAAGRQFQQRLGGFGGQMVGQCEQGVLGRRSQRRRSTRRARRSRGVRRRTSWRKSTPSRVRASPGQRRRRHIRERRSP